jgi:hypothetical protein
MHPPATVRVRTLGDQIATTEDPVPVVTGFP